jgi:Starch-binding associating with outer membrane
MPIDQQQIHIGKFAILDSATFLYNSKLPGIVITASEVNFLKAEAFERWGGGDAKIFYEKAIRQSVGFYFRVKMPVIIEVSSPFLQNIEGRLWFQRNFK